MKGMMMKGWGKGKGWEAWGPDGGGGGSGGGGGRSAESAAAKKKRKKDLPPNENVLTGPQDAKNKANHAIQMLISRSVSKGEIVYDVTESDGMFVAKFSCQAYKEGESYEGESAPDRRSAEISAAEKFLEA